MTNRILSYKGVPAVGVGGSFFIEPVAGTLNPGLGAAVQIGTPEAGSRSLQFVLADPLPAGVTAMRLLWKGFIGGQRRRFMWPVPASLVTDMLADDGTFTVVTDESDWLGPLAGTSPTGLQVQVLNAEGWGVVRDIHTAEAIVVETVEQFVKNADPVLSGTHTEGDALVYTPLDWDGAPGVVITDYLVPCEDTSKTNPGTAYLVPGNVPFIAAPKDAFFIRSYASGPGTANPSGPYDSAAVAITPLVVTPPDVSVASAALVATQQLKLKNVTNASFPKATSTGRATITAGTATATIVDYVAATGVLYLGDILNGPIAGNTAITSSAGGVAAADGASSAWAYKAGEAYYLAPPLMNGTPATFSLIPLAKYATDSAHADAKTIDLAGTFFKWLGTRYVEFAWEFTGQGVTGIGRAATSWLPIGVPTLDPIPSTDWFPKVQAEPGGGTRLVGIWLHESHIVDGEYWTTSSAARLESVQFPAEHEPTTYSAPVTTVVGGRTFALRNCSPAVYNGTDFAVFVSGSPRNDLLGITCLIGGAWTPLSARQTVPLIDVPATVLSNQERFVGRSPEQMMLDQMGGNCMQFPRAKDFDGDWGIIGHDVLQTCLTKNAAEDWETDHGDGLGMSQTWTGMLIDGNYVHGQSGSIFMRALGNYDTKAGMQRLDRTTMKWSLRKNLLEVQGSNSGTFRRNMRYIAKVAGSGTSHLDRTLYAIYAPGSSVYSSAVDYIQIIKASANGGDTWVNDGAQMAFATYGVPFELLADSTALYMCTSEGMWRRPIGSATWTKATGLGTVDVYHIEKHGSTLYACTSAGMFKAADGTTLAFSSIYSGNVLYFSICPTNTNRRVLCTSSGTGAVYTTQGDSGWTTGSSLEYPGQPGNFQHKMNGPAWVQFHTTDPNIVFAMRNQHPGKSDDGGKTFRYASKNYDYSEVRDFSNSLSSADVMLAGATDRLAIAYNAPFHAQDLNQDDDSDNKKTAVKDAVKAALGKEIKSFSMAGTMILERGNWRRYVAQIGEHTGNKALVVFERSATTTRTDQTATGNGTVSVVSTHNVPGGIYTFTCTTAGGTGVGKFRGRDSTGRDLGEWTVGTERVYTHPSGGTITATFSDGSVDFKAGANPAVITHKVNPVNSGSVINNAVKISTQYGETNPAVHYRGAAGRYVLSMDTSGDVTVLRTIPYMFQGYMGPGGSAMLASSGTTVLMRSADEGVTWATFASGLRNMAGVAFVVAHASPNDSQRAYAGHDNGRVTRIQNGTKETIFDWDAWLTAEGITTASPGNAQVNGRWCPPVMGIVECPFDANLVHIGLYVFGVPYAVFRSQNAQAAAASVEWENITYDSLDNGLCGPIQRLRQNTLTGEPILCSAKGSVLVDLPAGFRTAKGITKSLIADIRAMPGYSTFTKRI